MIGESFYQISRLYVGQMQNKVHILKVKKHGCMFKTHFHKSGLICTYVGRYIGMVCVCICSMYVSVYVIYVCVYL